LDLILIKTKIKKLCNSKLHNLYSSISYVRVIKQRQYECGKCQDNKKYIKNVTKYNFKTCKEDPIMDLNADGSVMFLKYQEIP